MTDDVDVSGFRAVAAGERKPVKYTPAYTLAALAGCTSSREWGAVCDDVKRENNGGYPGWWFPTMIQSGVIDDAAVRFGGRPGITVTTFA